MTDMPFVLAAYVVVLGGLAGYVLTLARRTAASRRLAAAVRREHGSQDAPWDVGGPLAAEESSEARR